MISSLHYIFQRTFHELFREIFKFLDFIIPDFTLFSPIRKTLLSIFWLFKIWKNTRIRQWTYFTHLKNLNIWNNCFINKNNIFDNSGSISIWDNCSIGYNNHFITTGHYTNDLVWDKIKTFYSKNIVIWNNVWITSNCTILPWVTIWDNSIIWAWSVVTRNIESNCVYWWVPARKIKNTKWIIKKTK